MQNIFNVGDIVIVKVTGTIPMKVISLKDEYDDEATIHLTASILSSLGNVEDANIDENFNVEEHKIYYVVCEWHNSNNKRIEEISRLNNVSNKLSTLNFLTFPNLDALIQHICKETAIGLKIDRVALWNYEKEQIDLKNI